MRRITKYIRKKVLHPWVLANKAETLELFRQQGSYRNHIVMSLYRANMGWQNINKALLGMGLPTVKAYYMERTGMPHIFFEMPNEERRKQLPRALTLIVQPNE